MPALSGRETPWAPLIPLAAIVGKIAGGWCNGVAGPSCFAQLRYLNGSNEGRLVTSDPNGPISAHTLTDRTVVGKFPARPLADSGYHGPGLWGLYLTPLPQKKTHSVRKEERANTSFSRPSQTHHTSWLHEPRSYDAFHHDVQLYCKYVYRNCRVWAAKGSFQRA